MKKFIFIVLINPLQKNKITVFVFLIMGLMLGQIFVSNYYKPSYESVTKLLVKSSNPLVNDINIINSNDVKLNVWKSLKAKYKVTIPDRAGIKKLQNSIIIDNPDNSNILILRSYWEHPQISQFIVSSITNEYIKHNYNKSEIVVIEKPNVINKLNRLIKLNYIINFLVFSFILAWILISIKSLLNDDCSDVIEIEDKMKAPVLGIIPWLDDDTYKAPHSLIADSLTSFYSLAYQKIITSIKSHSINNNSKVIAFTSAEFSKNRSTVLQNIATSMSKGGRSIIVIDADLRTPSIHSEFGLEIDKKFNIKTLLSLITESIANEEEFDSKYIYSFVQKVLGSPNLYVLTGNDNIADPFKYLFSPAFGYLIEKLKKRYDFVLIDTPPILAVPDAITISSYTDGLILITGLNVQKSTLKQLRKIFKEHQISLFGLITREVQTKEASSENEYIKQMISRMIPNETSQ